MIGMRPTSLNWPVHQTNKENNPFVRWNHSYITGSDQVVLRWYLGRIQRSCPCHTIWYLSIWFKNFKLYFIFLKICAILGNFMKNWYLITAELKFNLKILLHKYDTYNCDYLLHTIFYFYPINLWLYRFPFSIFSF